MKNKRKGEPLLDDKKKRIKKEKEKKFIILKYDIKNNDKICFLADSIYLKKLESIKEIKKPILSFKLSEIIEITETNIDDDDEDDDEDEDENKFSPIFSEELGNKNKSYYGYFRMEYKDLINYCYNNNHNYYFHEMIMDDTQIKFFFDFDLDISKNDQFDFFQRVGETVECFCEFVNELFQIEICFDDFIFLDCTRTNKYSMHVVLYRKIFCNNISVLFELINEFISFSFRKEKVPILSKCIMDDITNSVWLGKNIIDISVYKKYRTLRIFGSKKINSNDFFIEKKIKKNNGHFMIVKLKKTKSLDIFSNIMEKSLLHFIKSTKHNVVLYCGSNESMNDVDKIDIKKMLFEYHLNFGLKNDRIMKSYSVKKNLIVNLENIYDVKYLSDNKSNKINFDQSKPFNTWEISSSTKKEIIKIFSDIYDDYLDEKFNIKEKNKFGKLKFNGESILIDFQGVCSKIYESEKRYHNKGKSKSGLCLIYNIKTGLWFQNCKTEICGHLKSPKITVSKKVFDMLKEKIENK